MNIKKEHHSPIAFLVGVLVSIVVGYILLPHETQAPTTASGDEVHVHSDFLVYLDGVEIDLTDTKYMSSSDQVLHEDAHLHDHIDDVMHRHTEGVTLADFFGSLGFTLTDECIESEGFSYCSDDNNFLLVFVNGVVISNPAAYINQDEDQIVVYYGNPDDEVISELLEKVTDDACIYSGTCPERGAPPPESCGLTCEL